MKKLGNNFVEHCCLCQWKVNPSCLCKSKIVVQWLKGLVCDSNVGNVCVSVVDDNLVRHLRYQCIIEGLGNVRNPKSGNMASSGETGLKIRIHASPKRDRTTYLDE